VNLRRWFAPSVTSKPFADGCAFSISPWPSKAPPVATVWMPRGLHPLATFGCTSNCPAASIAFSFTTAMAMISSYGETGWPTPSNPAPAPMSTPARSNRSRTSLTPASSVRFSDCQDRFAWLAPIPLVSEGL